MTHEVTLTHEVLQRLRAQRYFRATLLLDRLGSHHVISKLLEVEFVLGHDRLNSCRAVRKASDSSEESATSFRASRTS